jgi:membrane-associated phospholipid phosphatase
MVDNKHWASDVIFGTAIGIVSGRAASLGHGQRVSVAPSLLPGGFGIAGSIRP